MALVIVGTLIGVRGYFYLLTKISDEILALSPVPIGLIAGILTAFVGGQVFGLHQISQITPFAEQPSPYHGKYLLAFTTRSGQNTGYLYLDKVGSKHAMIGTWDKEIHIIPSATTGRYLQVTHQACREKVTLWSICIGASSYMIYYIHIQPGDSAWVLPPRH